jgi:stalled ribosome rescue protein Dom34
MPRRRRGYPVAVLVGLGDDEAHLWDVYSESVKPGDALASKGSRYGLYEAVVDQLRPRVKEGVRTIVVASDERAQYNSFLAHVEKHHAWLTRGREMNKVTFTYLQGRAGTAAEVRAAAASAGLRSIIRSASEESLDSVMEALEKRLNTGEGIDSLMLSIRELEEGIYGEEPPEYIIMTEGFARTHRKTAQKLTQVAANRKVKTVTLPHDSRHAHRLEQLGGIVGMAKTRSSRE